MKVELFPPDSETEPRHWVRHDQAFAMMLGPGSIEWGSKRSALEKFGYAAGDLALCHRHEGEWYLCDKAIHVSRREDKASNKFWARPEWELRGNARFARANLLKAARLREKSLRASCHSATAGAGPSMIMMAT